MRRKTVLRVTALAMAWLQTGPAVASSCGLGGDLTKSRALAISLALAGEAKAAEEASPDDFVAGLTKIISHAPEAALISLERSTAAINVAMPEYRRRETIARNSYWAAVAFEATNRPAQAAAARRIATDQGATFYSTLAGGDPGRTAGGAYPTPRYDYIDQRTTPALVWAITREESRFRQNAISSAGALGLMQVMYATATGVARTVGMEIDRNRMLTDPHYNVAVGSTYLGALAARYHGYVPLVAAAYNAGEGCADVWLARLGDPRNSSDATIWIESIPIDETREYVQRVSASYSIYLRSEP